LYYPSAFKKDENSS